MITLDAACLFEWRPVVICISVTRQASFMLIYRECSFICSCVWMCESTELV